MADPERLRAKLHHATAIPRMVRAEMMNHPGEVEPGAVDVLQRFFAELRRLRAPLSCPPRACFDKAARSEPTLATLLRTLERFAPHVNLAEGRDARRAWYRRRGGGTRARPAPPAAAPPAPPAAWPAAWRPAHARLWAESPKASTARRHTASLDRCAQELARLGIEPEVDRFRALVLGEAFARTRKKDGTLLSPRTARNYLGAFLRLAQLLDRDPETVDGVRDAFELWRARAALAPKRRDLKLETWAEEGGSWDGAIELADELVAASDREEGSWRAAPARRRLVATTLMVGLNCVPRTGDMARWRIGEELRREDDGLWSLAYVAQKNDALVSFSRLWSETSRALDRLVLAGRPEEMLEERLAALKGRNWMRPHARRAVPAKYPSALIKEVLKLSFHPLRALAGDVLRVVDPKTGAKRTTALLGHRDARSEEEYRAAAEGRAAAQMWAACRERLRA